MPNKLVMSDADKAFVAQLKSAGVLVRVNGHIAAAPHGVIALFCSDGDQSDDLLGHLKWVLSEIGAPVRIHTPSLNGGALLLPADSPLLAGQKHRRDEVFLEDVAEAVEMKGFDTLILYGHVPCGKAAKLGLKIDEIIDLLVRARLRVLDRLPGLYVLAFCHFDKGYKKQTYAISPEQWEEWRRVNRV